MTRIVRFIVLLVVDSMDAAFRYWAASAPKPPQAKQEPKRWHRHFHDPV